MRRLIAFMAALPLLAACASAAPAGGVANYDALQRAQASCAAGGGTLALKKDGDATRIDAYDCERK